MAFLFICCFISLQNESSTVVQHKGFFFLHIVLLVLLMLFQWLVKTVGCNAQKFSKATNTTSSYKYDDNKNDQNKQIKM